MTDYKERIDALASRATADCDAFDSPADPPAEDEAMGYLREGVGPAVALYVEARTGPGHVPFDEAELGALRGAMNDWLSLYCRCYGTEFDPEFTVREAAELLVNTHNIRDVAQLLTSVPARYEERQAAACGGNRNK